MLCASPKFSSEEDSSCTTEDISFFKKSSGVGSCRSKSGCSRNGARNTSSTMYSASRFV